MGDFVTVPFTTTVEDLADASTDALRSSLAGWEPADGSVEMHLIEAVAVAVRDLMQMASTVPDSIFRQFGTQLIALAPLQGVAATLATTWTATDTLGHVIPSGTQVGYRVSGDTLVVFEVTEDATITAGASSLSPVTLTATDVGIAWNGVPAGPLELIDSLSWVDAVTANTPSSGGVDAETDIDYQDRLAAELRLMTPRPILPDDFAVLARRITGVHRALAIDGLDPGTNEIQRITITGTPTGGTLTVTYSAQTTAALAFDSTAAQVQAALIALSNIGSGDVVCTGGPWPGTAIDVEFTGALGGTNVAAMTTTDSLTGGTAPASAVTTPTGGVAGSTGNERMVTVIPVDTTGTGCSAAVRGQVQTYLDGLREVTFVVHTGTPTYTPVNVTYSIHVASGYDSATVLASVDAALTSWLSPASWAGGDASPPVWRTGETTARYNTTAGVIYGVAGVAYLASLSLNGGGAGVDVTLTGTAPLPTVGTLTGSTV